MYTNEKNLINRDRFVDGIVISHITNYLIAQSSDGIYLSDPRNDGSNLKFDDDIKDHHCYRTSPPLHPKLPYRYQLHSISVSNWKKN